MRTLVWMSLLVCACSQGDAQPRLLGDCQKCGSSLIGGSIGAPDASADVTGADAVDDVSNDVITPDDGGADSSDDGALLDSGSGE